MKKLLLSIASSAVLLSSCGNKDKNAPEFESIQSPLNQGAGVIELRNENVQIIQENNNTIVIKGSVKDDSELKELKIDIHNVTDGHSHKVLAEYEFLDVERIVDLSGKTRYDFNIEIDLSIYPNLISGIYDITIFATDKVGNQTTFGNGKGIKRQIYLKRPYQAEIVINEDDSEASNINLENNSKLNIDGYIKEKRGGRDLKVSFIRIEIVSGGNKVFDKFWGTSEYFRSNGQKLTGLSLPSFDDNELSFDDLLNTLGNDNYTAQIIHNNYTLRISVEDEKKNFTIREFNLIVSQPMISISF